VDKSQEQANADMRGQGFIHFQNHDLTQKAISSAPSCSVCNVSCTSQETLMAHAAGMKHKRRARAATAAAGGEFKDSQPQQACPHFEWCAHESTHTFNVSSLLRISMD
jgi:hypothetical protein